MRSMEREVYVNQSCMESPRNFIDWKINIIKWIMYDIPLLNTFIRWPAPINWKRINLQILPNLTETLWGVGMTFINASKRTAFWLSAIVPKRCKGINTSLFLFLSVLISHVHVHVHVHFLPYNVFALTLSNDNIFSLRKRSMIDLITGTENRP